MNLQRINELMQVHRDGLLKDVIPFWIDRIRDPEYGGYLHYLDRDGSVYHTDKSVWIQGRIAWLFALLYNDVEQRPEWLSMSRQGIEFVEQHCFDTDGRMFFEVTRDGRPLRRRRYLFSENFGVIAFAEYGRAAGDQRRVEKARELYRLLIKHVRNPHLLPPKVIPGTRASKAHSLTMILIVTTQELRKTGGDPLYDEVIDASLTSIFREFMHPEKKALLETVGPRGEFLDIPEGRCIIPGHAIETAWFIMEEYRHSRNPVLLEQACRILDWSLAWGWDKEFGGLLYFVDIEGRPCDQYEHDMKLWWPHNEAIYACLLAYHLTGRREYADWFERLHAWAFAHFPDQQYGEWFKYLHRDGTVANQAKGNRWASPFHLARMHLKCWKLLEVMAGDAAGMEPSTGGRQSAGR
ncbi:MAG: AGE family epimerase/isomerase [Kiritimatiellae bacterium]|nr:AGE family epimerase/isomerase [Kiritimatiellia bacterium]